MTDACPNCGAAYKSGLLSLNFALHKSRLRVINLVRSDPWDAACNKCGDSEFDSAKSALLMEADVLKRSLRDALPQIPIVSLQSPLDWHYRALTIVTAQTVTGTGIFSDVASAFTDLFGNQSGTYNAKLRDGENLCKASLRAQAIEAGGNAVLAVDVDYAEVGGQRAMLMVCMTGTVVDVSSFERPAPDFFEVMETARTQAARVRLIEQTLSGTNG